MEDNSRKRPLSVQWLSENSERVGQKPRVGSIDAGNATYNFSGQGIQLTGQGNLNVGGSINMTTNYTAPTTAAGDCLRDLFITDPFDDRTALKRKKGNRAAGTCEWILKTEELAAWLGQERTSNVLWLYGNPGIGKSTMAIFLTEELATTFYNTDGRTLLYFFCDSGFDKQKTATSVLRGLLFQLVEQHRQLLSHIIPSYEQRGRELFESFDALWKVFIAAAADQSLGQTYCIIDALDECDQESQNILLYQLQETFQNQNNLSNIRILITSRPYPEIREYLKVFTNKDLTSFHMVKADIDQYIKEKVTYLAKKKDYTASIQEQVGNILKDKAENTFLWIGLACEQLEKLFAKDAIRALQQMPKGLHSLYKKLLSTAQEGSEASIVQRILGLVAICVRPLSVPELSEACQLYEEEDMATRVQFTRDQIASCRLMIIVQDEKVLLLHQSVKDYLLGAGSGFFVDELEAHANLAYRCVNLLIKQFHREQSPIHLLSYAIKDWANHARMAQSSFKVRDSEAEFFRADSPSREEWLEALRSDGYFHRIPMQFSILHVASRWGVVALIDYIVSPNCQQLGTKAIPYLPDFDCIDGNGKTPIEEAIRSGNLEVFSKLLDLKVKVSERVTEAAARGWQIDKEAMALLLNHRGHEITITEKVVMAAAGNPHKDVMALLLEYRGHEITFTEEVVKAAARNSHKEVMALLLHHRGHEITITEEVVKAAARNSSKEVMALLLEYRGHEITITEEIVEAAAGNFNEEVMTLLFDFRDREITITKEIIETIARHSNQKAMALLLDRRRYESTITDEVIKAVSKNFGSGKEVIAFLLEQQKIVFITDSIVCTIAESFDEEIMALLFEKYGDEVAITEEAVKAATRNRSHHNEILTLLLSLRGGDIPISSETVCHIAASCNKGAMALLLHHHGDKVAVTEDVVAAAAANRYGKETIALLLDQRGNEITVTEKILVAVTRNGSIGKDIMSLLLDHRGNEITFTEKVISAIATVFDEKMIALLLKRRGNEITITETTLKAAARNRNHGKEVILLLLNQCGNIAITEQILKAAAGNSGCGKEVMSVLLDQRGYQITITDEVVEAAARHSIEVMRLLLSRRRNEITITDDIFKAAITWQHDTKLISLLIEQQDHQIPITEEVVKTAAEYSIIAEEILTLFLYQQRLQVTITEEVVKAAAENPFCALELMALLLNQPEHQVTITEEVVKAAAGNHRYADKIMAFLLNQRTHQVNITEEVVKAAAGSECTGKAVMAFLLKHQGDRITITEEVVKAAAGNQYNGKEVMTLLLNQRGHQITITEEVLIAAAGNQHHGKEVMTLLLNQRGHQITITEEVLIAAAGNWDNGKQVITLLLNQRGHQITITEEVVKAAAGNWYNGKEVMALLLNQRGHQITVTEEVLKAAAGNEHCGKEVMILLLNQRRDQITITENVIKTAAACGQDDILDLLSQESNIVADWDRWRCISKFYNAILHEDICCIKQLMNKGIYLDTKNIRGETPLWVAAKFGSGAVVKLLAQQKDVNINSVSISGRSPLFEPSQKGRGRMVAILMEAGADPNLVDKDGQTAITIAQKYGHAGIVKILERV
ncbi:hypothetical protein HDV62DRAFT_357636 [Trichoderma sp. SZMC 28011]